MANARIDDLRRKLDKEPGSRLFAQLAEELRKDGQLAEAVRVARQGLDRNSNYPSARMTLGRALLDSGELGAARREFESVLAGAPDNILASRFLAECLEGLGLVAEALARYRSTLALAPGDKQVMARIEALERGPRAPSPPGAPAPVPAAPAVPAAAAPPPAPTTPEEPAAIRVVEIDEPMELVSPYAETAPGAPARDEAVFEVEPDTEPQPVAAGEAPIPLVPIEDEEFELERPYDARAALQAAAGAPAPAPPPPAGPPAPAVEPELEPDAALGAMSRLPEPELVVEPEPDVIDEEFEVEAPRSGPPHVTFRDFLEEPPAPAAEHEAPGPVAPPAPAEAATPEPELASATLAELYFGQGFVDKAIEVYRRLLQREPGQERVRIRLAELESLPRPASAPSSAVGGEGLPPERRQVVQSTIDRLEGLRAALARRS